MFNLVIKNREEQDKYAVELLERVCAEDNNNIKGYSLRTSKREMIPDIMNDVIVPPNDYYVSKDWTVKLENNKIYIISEYICSVIDLNKEELFGIFTIFG